jgi:SAM-dependent methyltransferase
MNVPSNWWQDFFHGVAVDLWLQAMPEAATRAEVDFIEKTLHLPASGRVLDVPCGGGRHAIELAARGYQVTGVDISTDSLAFARSTAKERGATIALHEQDMRNLPWPAAFDGAFSFGNSFGYMDDDANADFLKAVANTLKPGASFLLQIGIVAEAFLPTFPECRWYPMGDILFLVQNDYDHVHSRLNTEYTFIRDGKIDRRYGCQRVYTFRELRTLLQEAGFVGVEGFASLDREPFRLGASRGYTYFVARKPPLVA